MAVCGPTVRCHPLDAAAGSAGGGTPMSAQCSITDEIIVDNFAGGVRSGAGKCPGMVRHHDYDNGTAAGSRGDMKEEMRWND